MELDILLPNTRSQPQKITCPAFLPSFFMSVDQLQELLQLA